MRNDAKDNDQIIDRLPPQDINAEISVLGAMLQDAPAIGKAVEVFGDDGDWYFYKSEHQKIYNAMVAMFGAGKPIDALTLSDELKKREQLDFVGGNLYLTYLISCTPSSANIEYHTRIVFDKARLRALVGIGVEITNNAFSPMADSESAIDVAEQKIFDLSAKRVRKGFVSLNPVLDQSFSVLDHAHENPGGITGVPTGLKGLDEMLGGLQRSDLIIIAGRPSFGKTALALNISRNTAVDYKTGVGIFSLEMAAWQLGFRLICSEARVDSHLARTGKLKKDQVAKLAIAAKNLNNAPIYIDDTPSITAMEVRAKARRLVAEKNVGLFIIDYLQIMRHPGRENRNVSIGETTQALKGLAKELNVPVVVLSQLSRKVDDRSDSRPIISDLRESGAIEQDADVVMFPFAPDGRGCIIIGKQRNGPIGDVPIMFLKEYVMFANLENNYQDNRNGNGFILDNRTGCEPDWSDVPPF